MSAYVEATVRFCCYSLANGEYTSLSWSSWIQLGWLASSRDLSISTSTALITGGCHKAWFICIGSEDQDSSLYAHKPNRLNCLRYLHSSTMPGFYFQFYTLPNGTIFTLILKDSLKRGGNIDFSMLFKLFYQKKTRYFLICIINKNKGRAINQQGLSKEQSKKQPITIKIHFNTT